VQNVRNWFIFEIYLATVTDKKKILSVIVF